MSVGHMVVLALIVVLLGAVVVAVAVAGFDLALQAEPVALGAVVGLLTVSAAITVAAGGAYLAGANLDVLWPG